ncbi:unnamed protein product [Sphagnum balticum]
MNMLTSGARHLARLPSRRTRAVPIQTTTNAMAIVLRHQVRTVMSVYQNTPTTFQSATAAVAVDEVHQQQQPDERRRACKCARARTVRVNWAFCSFDEYCHARR